MLPWNTCDVDALGVDREGDMAFEQVSRGFGTWIRKH